MNKNEFLQKLKEDLSSLSDEERLNALKYYEEYFADAEEEKEEIITGFESPEDLAQKIENEIKEMTERTPAAPILKLEEKIEEEPQELVAEVKREENNDNRNYSNSREKKNNNNNKDNKTVKLILILCTAPFWLPLLIGAASIAFGVLMTLFGIAFALVAMAVAGFIMIGAGFMSVGYGVSYIFIDIVQAFYPIGAGLVVAGIGIIMAYGFTKLSTVMFKSQVKFIGWTVRKIARRGA